MYSSKENYFPSYILYFIILYTLLIILLCCNFMEGIHCFVSTVYS